MERTKRIEKPVGVKEIARELGVSIGTVDRALHGRPGINPLTRKRVLKLAETLGYRPNLAARYLKSGRQLRFSVNLPREIASFFDSVREGVMQAASSFQPAVHVDFRTSKRLGDEEVHLFEEALHDGVNGIIIAPGHPALMKPLIDKAAQQNVPVVCVATDAPGTKRLTAVSADSYTNGAMAAEMLCHLRPSGGAAVVFTGFPDTVDHAEKVRGFRECLGELGAPLTVEEVIETHDDEREAFLRTTELLEARPDLAGIYVTTANSLGVVRAVQKADRLGRVALITTDLFPELVPLIRRGRIAVTMYQRPLTQGRMAFEALYRFVTDRWCPPAQTRLIPLVVMRSNLDLVLEKLPKDADY